MGRIRGSSVASLSIKHRGRLADPSLRTLRLRFDRAAGVCRSGGVLCVRVRGGAGALSRLVGRDA